MTIPPRAELARLLGGEQARPAHGWVTIPTGAPVVTVAGYGTVKLPIARPQAVKLRALAEPAPYGLGEETLTDASVRHTWLIPAHLVSVDWGDHLDAVLESTRSALGLPPTTALTAEFHSMLVYEVGQFFLPHQDSEKHDDMVATLVVVLPSAHSGGELVVHGAGREAAYPGSREHTTAVAFYADQVHEVRPVRTGHRISLTYNIFARQQSAGSGSGDEIDQAAEHIRRHFAHRPPPRWTGDVPQRPVRLAYLLDHHYSERSLAWERLKGVDIERAAALRIAGDIAGCEVSLGLLDIQETSDADDSGQLLDSSVSLTQWLSRDAAAAQPVGLILADADLCATTPTRQLPPVSVGLRGLHGQLRQHDGPVVSPRRGPPLASRACLRQSRSDGPGVGS
ncbi:2OG-Fe(II) oxygenase [Nostocoides jenkinsii]|uniref:Fe2OG dioxygenase domain-containing protein n=1 Tax=Nostocoides jenkinsii Ben 74 TaxID=1193518 RepID=A0A077M6X4_9MICO|nr:2OG-Fe(II) oxygenase [Tetrasphaera jenkinsii]CCI51540.1 hypothetical protein BN13_1080013 [Tetrasphaera jenkinsii Ben 74]